MFLYRHKIFPKFWISKLSKSFSIREFLKIFKIFDPISLKQILNIQYSSKLQNIQFIIKCIKILFKQRFKQICHSSRTRIQHETKFSRKFHRARGWNNEEKRNESWINRKKTKAIVRRWAKGDICGYSGIECFHVSLIEDGDEGRIMGSLPISRDFSLAVKRR